ncbi:NAD(P)/FAD-dependent oxidoreductase [Luteimonas sp. RIT-PG2_3]
MRSNPNHNDGGGHWDLVVVGASFAGAACALAARRAGLRVCVIERKRDPGIKLHTTGIIVKEAAEQTLLSRIPAAYTRRVDGVRLYAPALHSRRLQRADYYFLTTDTPAVMRWLADQLIAAGVELRLMQSFTDARRHDGGWLIDGLGHARWLVGADGAKSRVAARTGLDPVRDFLYGVEYEYAGLQLHEPDALHCFISKRYAPGYIGWAAQGPTGTQFGLAFRHDARRSGVPDIQGLLAWVGPPLGIAPDTPPTATRAGLIPCGGAVRRMTAPGVILTGDAAGIVSPVTAGGIHSAWRHGEVVGDAIARHMLDGGPSPERIAGTMAPRFRGKKLLRMAFDRLQADWPFDLLLHSSPLRWAAERVYFSRRR